MRYIAYVIESTTLQETVEIYKALSDTKRLRLVRILSRARRPLCLPELVDILMEPQYAVSRGVSILRRAGLVEEERRGKVVYVSLSAAVERYGVTKLVDALVDEKLATDDDRLRWRLSIREDGDCAVTYTRGYAPADYGSGGREPRRVLFVCVHNTARSQIAEEYLRRAAGDLFEVESAGLEPGTLNPYVVRILADEGIDISHKKTRSVFDVYRRGLTYSRVITVCSREAEEKCPVFPGPVRRLNWPFPDPSAFTGTEDEILDQTREVARQIRQKITAFVAEERARLGAHRDGKGETA